MYYIAQAQTLCLFAMFKYEPDRKVEEVACKSRSQRCFHVRRVVSWTLLALESMFGEWICVYPFSLCLL
jgi:hypothetical protein